MFKQAVKEKLKAKICLDGGSGSGKTYSALLLAEGLSENKKIALIDTENRSASLYADRFKFDVLDLYAPYTPKKYVEAIKAAEQAGYSVLIIDSITHEWNGEGGCLDIQTALGGRYQDWAKVTPLHNEFVGAILNSKMHIIATVRSKMGYDMGADFKGKLAVQKVGLQPITRDGFEYEMTVVFSLNQNHYVSCNKDRTSMFDGKDFIISAETGAQMLSWLNSGVEVKSEAKAELVAEVVKLAAVEVTKPVTKSEPVAQQPAAPKAEPTPEPVTKSNQEAPKQDIDAGTRKALEGYLKHKEYGPITAVFMKRVGAKIDDCTVDQYNQIVLLSKEYIADQNKPDETKEADKVPARPIDPTKKDAITGQINAINAALKGKFADLMQAELKDVFREYPVTLEELKYDEAVTIMTNYGIKTQQALVAAAKKQAASSITRY